MAGKIIFFYAFPEKGVSIKLDIMNPHYPKYYSDDEVPADWQNPIKFLTVENTSFNFVLALNKKETDQNRD
ncbi:MAG: type III-B CRISPR module RAMP protein Cmr6 [Desulfobacterales bacterium]|nr:type III-B CRISPR module RAMP protein Cmr6 [Desulfobacterales bacterium]